MSHELRPKKLYAVVVLSILILHYASVAVPPASDQIPNQWPLAPGVTSVV